MEAQFSEAGVVALRAPAAGAYEASIRDSEGVERWSEILDLVPGQEEVSLEMSTVHVMGRVQREGKGVATRLSFALGRGKGISARSDSDGGFEVDLPRHGSWDVRIGEDSAPTQRRVWIPKRGMKPGSAPRIEISLSTARIGGRVVDASGTAAAGAGVMLVTSAGSLLTRTTGPDGRFAFQEVEAGDAVLAARRPRESSEDQELVVPESGEVEDLELMLLPTVNISGSVHSTYGGIPGATLLGYPETATGVAFTPVQSISGQDGLFELQAPAGAIRLRLAVSAPGFPLKTIDVPVERQRELLILVNDSSLAGEVVLKGFESYNGGSAAPGDVLLFSNGVPLPAPILSRWARINGSPSRRDRLRIPRLEPGDYAICVHLHGRELARAFRSGGSGVAGCERLQVYAGDTTEFDLAEGE